LVLKLSDRSSMECRSSAVARRLSPGVPARRNWRAACAAAAVGQSAASQTSAVCQNGTAENRLAAQASGEAAVCIVRFGRNQSYAFIPNQEQDRTDPRFATPEDSPAPVATSRRLSWHVVPPFPAPSG